MYGKAFFLIQGLQQKQAKSRLENYTFEMIFKKELQLTS